MDIAASEHAGQLRHRDAFLVVRVAGDPPGVGVTDEELGNTSWVVGLDREVVVVDAERDPAPYLSVAEHPPGRPRRHRDPDLLALPDDVAVFPTRRAGSFCSAAGGSRRWSTIGAERRTNPLLQDTMDGRSVGDVRRASGFAAGHVPGAVHVELGGLAGATCSLPGKPLVVTCGRGERAATAARVPVAARHPDVATLDGGPADWTASRGRDLVR